jgi:hypothetical protein
MKLILIAVLSLMISHNDFSQDIDLSKVSSDNTWFKVGLNACVPLQPSNSSFILALDASAQFLETKASGIGMKSGY